MATKLRMSELAIGQRFKLFKGGIEGQRVKLGNGEPDPNDIYIFFPAKHEVHKISLATAFDNFVLTDNDEVWRYNSDSDMYHRFDGWQLYYVKTFWALESDLGEQFENTDLKFTEIGAAKDWADDIIREVEGG